jgi:transcription elongation factor Elf1
MGKFTATYVEKTSHNLVTTFSCVNIENTSMKTTGVKVFPEIAWLICTNLNAETQVI